MSDSAGTPDAQTLRTALQALAAQLGKPPTVVQMHDHGPYNPETYVDVFGSWEDALAAADLDPENVTNKITDVELLTDLQRLAAELERPPTKPELTDKGKYSAKTYQDRFGSWNQALQEAMLDTHGVSDRELTRELQRLADALGRLPRPSDMAEQGKHGSVTYYRRFGSWDDALQQATLPTRADSSDAPVDDAADTAPETKIQPQPLVTAQELARTYSSPTYADPWDAVEDYRRVRDYTAAHPDKGSSAVATALALPRGRIRPWMEHDARPDPVRGIEAAEANDWLPLLADSEVFPAFNVLVAWVFSGGSIDRQYRPSFVVDCPGTRHRVTDAIETLGVAYDVVRETTQARATEVRPTHDATVLGRILTVLGAPQGEKNEAATISLPSYLARAPSGIRATFVDIYLLNRGQTYDDKAMLSVREIRSQEFLDELAALFRDVSGGPVNVSDKNIHLSAEAARDLYGTVGPQWDD